MTSRISVKPRSGYRLFRLIPLASALLIGGAGASAAAAPAAGAAAAPVAAAPAPQPSMAPTTSTAAISSTREILLNLNKRTISLMEGRTVLGSWPVAIGDPATPTPTGRFRVQTKVINPQYQSTVSGKVNPTIGPNGPLGDRWIGFHSTARDQFGIHGTPAAWAWAVQQRAAVTHGCVRMLGAHVRQLFDAVDIGTPVVVVR